MPKTKVEHAIRQNMEKNQETKGQIHKRRTSKIPSHETKKQIPCQNRKEVDQSQSKKTAEKGGTKT